MPDLRTAAAGLSQQLEGILKAEVMASQALSRPLLVRGRRKCKSPRLGKAERMGCVNLASGCRDAALLG